MKLQTTSLSIILSGILSLVLPMDIAVGIEEAANTTTASSTANNDKLPLADLQRFTTVVEHIKNYYVKTVDDSTLFENAMKGMLAGLDPHSSYLDKDDYADLKAATTGKFGGLGIEVLPEDGLIRVISPIDDTPAQRAGIHAGDIIVRLNDTPVKGLSLREAIEMMRGEKGTSINLTIIRPGENKPLKIAVTRDTINVRSVRSEMLEDNFGYVRVSQFQSNSGEEFIQAIQTLKKTSGSHLKGLIIDLRNNPGGVLDASVQIADAFLDRDKLKYDGMIVYTKGRMNGSQIKEKAHTGDLLSGAPIIVMVNGGSASASEIVAGALQDHRRGLVVGTQTFGKGSVQTVLPLKDNRGLKLTTALYYTPAGRSIQADGIKPDIVVQNLKIPTADAESSALLLREEDLRGHLANGNNKEKDKESTVTPVAPPAPASSLTLGGKKILGKDGKELPLINRDYQLSEALNILKGLALLKNQS